jgi:hypothetical protein
MTMRGIRMTEQSEKEKPNPGQGNQSISSREVRRMNDTTKKDKWWIYLIFFLIGIVSLFTGFFIGRIPLFDGGLLVMLLPLPICSYLLHLTIKYYSTEKYSSAFVFVTLAASIIIFLIGFIFGYLVPLFLLLIIFATGLIIFKNDRRMKFALTAFVVSFGTIFIIFSAVFTANSPLSLLFFFGHQEDATTSTGISIESSAENITIYVPVLLDENKNVLKMYENPEITGNVTTAVIDTEYGKALMISGSGLGDYLFNWNEIPGKDTDQFVKWLEGEGHVQPGEKLDIKKTDDGRTITVSGISTRIYQLNEKGVLKFYRIEDIETDGSSEVYLFNWNEVPGKDTDRFVKWLEGEGHVQPGEKLDISKTDDGRTITVSGRGTWTYWLNDKGELEFHGVNNNVMSETFGQGLLFTKEENGQLNIYSGNNELNMNEKHGILKEDTQTSDEFLRSFKISMSNYTSLEPSSKIDAWVYSDSEVEIFSFGFSLDPGNRRQREVLSIRTEGRVHLRKGWQVVNLSSGIMCWD